MTITSVYMDTMIAGAGTASQDRSAERSTNSFDSFFNKEVTGSESGKAQKRRDTRQASVSTQKSQNDGQAAAKEEAKTEDMDRSAKEVVKEGENMPETEKTQPTPESKEAKPVTGTDTNEAVEAVAALLKKIANLLDMTEDAVLQILSQLNLTPADLTDKASVSAFLQEVFGVESPAELLNVPEMNTIAPELAQAVAEFEQAVSVTPAETQSTATAGIYAQANLAVAADTQMSGQNNAYAMAKAAVGESETVAIAENTEEQLETAALPEIAEPAQKQSDGKESGANRGQNGLNQDSNAAQDAGTLINTPEQGFAAQETSADQFVKEMVRTESTRNINTQDVVNQIVEKMKVEIKGNVSEVRITLKPEHLGEVTLKISTENGIITAQFVAESQRVKEAIEANFNQLKDMLQEQGLSVAELSVSVGQDGQDERLRQFLAQQQAAAVRLNRITRNAEIATEGAQEEAMTPDARELLNNSVEFTA